MKHTKLFVGALLMMAALIACEAVVDAPLADEPTNVDDVLLAAAASESRGGTLKSSSAACIQPTISLGAVTIIRGGVTPTAPTVPGIDDLIRVEVTSSSPAPNYMWGRVRITDSGGTTRKVLYLFYPGRSTADYGKPAHYVRGELAEGRTVSFEITEAHVFRSGDNCFSTVASTVRTALPEPAEVAPEVIAGAGTAEVPPTTGGVARSVGASGRKQWARQQWTDADTPTNPPVWLNNAHGLYANGEWHGLTMGDVTTELIVAPVKMGPRTGEPGMMGYYSSLGEQTCRLFVDTGGHVLYGGFLNHRPRPGLYYPDRIQGTQAAPQVFEFDAWNDTLVVNGGQTLNVAMICRDSW